MPYVLLDSLQKLRLPWQAPKLSKGSAVLQFGDVVATLQYSPFQLQLNRNKDVLLVLNGRSMFHFEHTREKKVIYTPHVQNFAQDLAIPDVFDVSGVLDAPMVLEITLITAAGIIAE